jgi:hypothetical protein
MTTVREKMGGERYERYLEYQREYQRWYYNKNKKAFTAANAKWCHRNRRPRGSGHKPNSITIAEQRAALRQNVAPDPKTLMHLSPEKFARVVNEMLE